MPPPPRPLAALLLLLLTAAHATPTATNRSQNCPPQIPQDPPQTRAATAPRIVGGDLISTNLAPYLVLIQTEKQGDTFLCTGTLLSRRWVLTAAHCGITASNSIAAVGIPSAAQATKVYQLARAESHPDYVSLKSGAEADIAAFQLAEDAADGAKFMKVSVEDARPEPGSFIRAMGYGTTEAGTSTDGVLRQVDVPVTSFKQCSDAYTPVNGVVEGPQFCAGYVGRGGCDACQGDSGGPVIQYIDDEPVLVGVTSSGVGCARPDFPGVYVRTAFYASWLNRAGVDYRAAGDDAGISTGAIAGIVVGVLVLIALAVVAAVLIRRRKSPGGGTAPAAPQQIPQYQSPPPAYPPQQQQPLQPQNPGTAPTAGYPTAAPAAPASPSGGYVTPTPGTPASPPAVPTPPAVPAPPQSVPYDAPGMYQYAAPATPNAPPFSPPVPGSPAAAPQAQVYQAPAPQAPAMQAPNPQMYALPATSPEVAAPQVPVPQVPVPQVPVPPQNTTESTQK